MEIYFWNTLLRFIYYLFIEVIFEGSCFELQKSFFDLKHTRIV
jgi:hypothetical protein